MSTSDKNHADRGEWVLSVVVLIRKRCHSQISDIIPSVSELGFDRRIERSQTTTWARERAYQGDIDGGIRIFALYSHLKTICKSSEAKRIEITNIRKGFVSEKPRKIASLQSVQPVDKGSNEPKQHYKRFRKMPSYAS